MKKKKFRKSVLEGAFERGYKKRLIAQGFKFETQVTIPGARFRYDLRLTQGDVKILLEIDGHGLGHNSVVSKARDCRKGNFAVFSGYLFFRLSTKHFPTKKKRRVCGPYVEEWFLGIRSLAAIRASRKYTVERFPAEDHSTVTQVVSADPIWNNADPVWNWARAALRPDPRNGALFQDRRKIPGKLLNEKKAR